MGSDASDTETFHDAEVERALDLYIDHLDGHINRAIFLMSGMGERRGEQDKYRCVSLMLLHAGISLQNIKKFYNPITLHSKDVVLFYRVIFESIINALFVLASSEEMARRALKHAQQKRFRSHGKEIRLGPYVARLEVENFPDEIREYIDEFTSKKGREKNWTDLSISERIDVVANRYGSKIWLTLGSSYYGYYGISSEHVHGSLSGVLEFIGAMNKEEFFANMKSTIWTVLIESGCAVIALLDALEIETGIEQFKEVSRELGEIILTACDMLGSEEK
jgi:hypothetical protein